MSTEIEKIKALAESAECSGNTLEEVFARCFSRRKKSLI